MHHVRLTNPLHVMEDVCIHTCVYFMPQHSLQSAAHCNKFMTCFADVGRVCVSGNASPLHRLSLLGQYAALCDPTPPPVIG